MIYDSWADQIINLPTDMAGEYAQKLLQYAIYGEEVSFDNPALNAMFISVKKRLDEDLEKYQAQVERAKAVSKRNRTKSYEVVTKSNEVEGDNDNDNENVNVIKEKKYKKKKNTFHNFPEREYDFSELKVGTEDV